MKDYLKEEPKLIKNNVSKETPILIHQAHHKIDIPYHYHNIIQILFLIKGNAVLYLNNKTYQITDLDMIYINKADNHKLVPDLKTSIVYVIEFATSIINTKKYSSLYNFFNTLKDENKIISLKSPTLSKTIINFQDMLFEAKYKNQDYMLVLENRLIDILLSIKRFYSIKVADLNTTDEDIYNKNIIKNVLDYIDTHYYEKLTLDSISHIAHLSKRQFTRIFKKITGLTFVEYLNSIRIKKAQDMLINQSDNEIIYVCFEVGFNDLSYFYRIFKKQTGITPKEYIKARNTKL